MPSGGLKEGISTKGGRIGEELNPRARDAGANDIDIAVEADANPKLFVVAPVEVSRFVNLDLNVSRVLV